MKYLGIIAILLIFKTVDAQEVIASDQTEIKLQQALQKKAEYHKATNGELEGYRIKIHFGIDKEAAENVRAKFQKSFPDCLTYREYQQPNFVVLVGDYRSKLEAFKFLNDIKMEFPNAYIIKDKINVK